MLFGAATCLTYFCRAKVWTLCFLVHCRNTTLNQKCGVRVLGQFSNSRGTLFFIVFSADCRHLAEKQLSQTCKVESFLHFSSQHSPLLRVTYDEIFENWGTWIQKKFFIHSVYRIENQQAVTPKRVYQIYCSHRPYAKLAGLL